MVINDLNGLAINTRFWYSHVANCFYLPSVIYSVNLNVNDFTREISGLVTRKATGWIDSVSENGQELRGNTPLV